MVKWDDVMKDKDAKQGDDKKKTMEGFRSLCNCPPCPTYADCAKQKGELAFCLSGKSSCIKEMRVCYCPSCPVHEELDLEFMYYCIRGDEGVQRGKGPKA